MQASDTVLIADDIMTIMARIMEVYQDGFIKLRFSRQKGNVPLEI